MVPFTPKVRTFADTSADDLVRSVTSALTEAGYLVETVSPNVFVTDWKSITVDVPVEQNPGSERPQRATTSTERVDVRLIVTIAPTRLSCVIRRGNLVYAEEGPAGIDGELDTVANALEKRIVSDLQPPPTTPTPPPPATDTPTP